MARRFRKTPKFARRRQHDWQRVRAAVTCNLCTTPHPIQHPAWALFGKPRPDGLRLIACEVAASKVYGQRPPAPLYNSMTEGEDVKARASGE